MGKKVDFVSKPSSPSSSLSSTTSSSSSSPSSNRDRTTSTSSTASYSSTSSSSSSRRNTISRMQRPWQLVPVSLSYEQDVEPRKKSGGMRSPYPTPGRKNFDRV
ncbi:hypothetical protein MMC21_003535 [Puttea exsequens]|nr:hypothetical protein [Puttea exsequens]